jgi:hypothetical protein
VPVVVVSGVVVVVVVGSTVVVVVGPAAGGAVVGGTVVVGSGGTFTTVEPGDVAGVVVTTVGEVGGEVVLGALVVVVAAGATGAELDGAAAGELRELTGVAPADPGPPPTGKVTRDRTAITPMRPSSEREVLPVGPRPDLTPEPERERRVKIPPGANGTIGQPTMGRAVHISDSTWARSYSSLVQAVLSRQRGPADGPCR